MNKGYKKSLLVVTILLVVSMTACGNRKNVSPPKITISDIQDGTETTSTDKQVNVADSTTVIDGEILDLMQDSTIIDDMKEYATITEHEKGIQIETTSIANRQSVSTVISQHMANVISTFKEKDIPIIINYDLSIGYIDIYCDSINTKEISELVNLLSGYLALNQKITNNTKDWVVTVTVNDKETGELILREGIYSGNKFQLSENNWTLNQTPNNESEENNNETSEE